MIYTFRLTAVLVLCILSLNYSSGQALLDGFMVPKQSGAVALSYSYESYDQFYLGDEKSEAPGPYGGEISTQCISLYARYGLSDQLNLVFNLPYIIAKGNGDPADADQEVEGLQDVSLFLQWLAYSKTYTSGTLSIVPVAGIATPLSDYEENAVLSIGNGSTRFDVRGLAQYKFENGLFANAQVGYSFRSNDVPNALILSGKIGYAHSKFYVDLGFKSQISDSDAPDIGAEIPFNETRVNYTQLGLSLYCPIAKSLGASFSTARYIDGRNVGLANRFSGSVVYAF